MNEHKHDAGVIQALLDRLNNQRLPRLMDLKDKIDTGEILSDLDLQFLEEVFADAQKARPLIDRHPEYRELSARVIRLYKDILDKAVENEKKA
ncbi:MAG: hypothetical protein ABFS22_14260 [Pseudomonadota bacterium]